MMKLLGRTFAIMTVATATMVCAQQVILVGDTEINSSSPSTKSGGSPTLNVNSTYSTLLSFDLSGSLPNPSASQVLKAKLYIFAEKVTTAGTVNVYQVNDSWAEDSVNYSSRPPLASSAVSSAQAVSSYDFIEFNVTSLVQKWLTTPSTNYGIELRASGKTNITFDSKENLNTSHSAILSVMLSGPAGPAGANGAKGATGATGAKGATGPQGPAGTLKLPYSGSASTSGTVFTVTNTSSADAFSATGGKSPNTDFANGGTGITARGGDSAGGSQSTGGANGIFSQGGDAIASYDSGGSGGAFFGGTNGNGIQTQGGNGATFGIVAYPSGSQYSAAGYFAGDVTVVGNLSKSGGSFKIDDPVDPDSKYLYHSFVESPDMMNIYNGNAITDGGGTAIVVLPDWFEPLNRDFRYQVTVIGQPAQACIASKVANSRFVIRTDKGGVEVSWQVTGIRQDAWANAHRIPVEVEKDEKQKGHYLHPELFGHAGESNAVEASHPGLRMPLPQKQ